MEKGKKILSRRVWLRPASSWGPNSTCVTTVEVDSYRTRKPSGTWGAHRRSLEGTLSMSDCTRAVQYSFDAHSDKHAAKHLAMMNKLLNEITLLRDAWVEAQALVHERGGWKS